jgi:hypothetical protein
MMLKQALEAKGIHLNSSEFAVVMEIVTDDIKFNRIGFKKKTSMEDVISIAEKSVQALRRC